MLKNSFSETVKFNGWAIFINSILICIGSLLCIVIVQYPNKVIFIVVSLSGIIIASSVIYSSFTNFIKLLIIWLPLQNIIGMVVYKITNIPEFVQPLLAWKEIFLIIGLAYVLLKRRRHYFFSIDYLYVFMCLYIMLYAILPSGILGVDYTMNARILGFRAAILPFILYLFGRLSEISAIEFKKIIRTYIAAAVFVCMFGFIELLLPYEFWLDLGFVDFKEMVGVGIAPEGWTQDKKTFFYGHFGGHEIQRINSTFGSPLHVAFYLILPIFIIGTGLIFRTSITKKINGLIKDKFILMILICGLILTIVRGPIIGLIATILLAIAIYVKGTKKIYYYIVCLVVVSVFFFVFNNSIMQIVSTTISLDDASAMGHFMAYENAIEVLPQHPFGFGLGQSGSVGKTYGSGESVGESLFFTTTGDIGFPGLILLLLIIISSIVFLHRRFKLFFFKENSFLKVMTFALICSTIAYFISSFNTEQWRGFTMSGLYWFLLGQIVRSHVLIDKGKNNVIT